MSADYTMQDVEEELEDDKITVLPGASADGTATTYCIMREDHTLGNLLRWMIMKNPAVEFCGYSAPHPSEEKIHIRIQTYDGVPTLKVLHDALNNCEAMTEAILEAYNESLAEDDYAKPKDLQYDFESVNDRLWAEKEAKGLGSREEFEAAKKARQDAEELAKPKLKAKKAAK